MKANGGGNPGGKDRKRKICDLAAEQDRTKVPQSASRRHREKINATLEELGGLLPLPEEARSKLDKLTVLKLSVSFFQTQNYLHSGKRKRRVDDASVGEITRKLEDLDINVSDISLEALDSFFLVLSETGDVFFASENVYRYLGYTQTFLMHQNFLHFVHQEDVLGFERCLRRSARARIMELDDGVRLDCQEFEEQPIPQLCFCSIKCHAGRQSSHVSPFYYRSFKFDGKVKPLLSGKKKQYGFFALVTPVNPANPFTSTPKELLQLYSCKMGLDLRIRKLDNRGQKSLFYADKEATNLSGYMVGHPDDIPSLILCHEQVTATGVAEIVFRLKNGQGKFQWIRGKARTLYDKNNKPEAITADNVLLNDEQGPYFKRTTDEMLLEWKSRQKGLPSPESDDDKPLAKESSQDEKVTTGGPQGKGLPTGAALPSGSRPIPPGRQYVPDEPCPADVPCTADRPYPPPPNGRLPQGKPCPPSGPHPARPAPMGEPFSSSRPHPTPVQLPPSSRESDGISAGQGMTTMPDEVMLEDSKDIEIIEFHSPATVAEPSGPQLPTFDLTTGSSDSCMFSSPYLNRSPVEVKPNVAHSGSVYNFKTESRNDASHMYSKRNKSAHEQINRIKQFLMGGEPDSLSNLHQAENTVSMNGGGIHDVPNPWSNYPVDTSPVLPEVNFPEDDECSVTYPMQSGMQPSFQTNGCAVPGMIRGNANSTQFVGPPQQPDTNNLIYPFLPDMNGLGHANSSNAFVNGVGKHEIPQLTTTIDGLNKTLQNGSEFNPAFLPPEATLPQPYQPRYQTSQNALHHNDRDGCFTTVVDSTPGNHYALDYMVNSSVTGIPRQDSSLWYSSTSAAKLAQNLQGPPKIDDVLSVDELTPSLCVDPMAQYTIPGQFHNGHLSDSVHSSNVYPSRNGLHLNHSVGQSFQKQNFQKAPGGAKNVDPTSAQGGNSLLKMMLTL